VPEFNSSNAECFIYTFKEGLLSSFAHDLKLEVSEFEIEIGHHDGVHPPEKGFFVNAVFDAASVRAVCAMKDGVESPGTLLPKDIKEIENNTAETVLQSSRFPRIQFRSEDISANPDNLKITGKLTVCRATRTVTVTVERRTDKCVATATVNQPDFGIKPFSALLGAIRVKPDVAILVRAPFDCFF
jgi:hypothetical protein